MYTHVSVATFVVYGPYPANTRSDCTYSIRASTMLYFHLLRFDVCLADSMRTMKLAAAPSPLKCLPRPSLTVLCIAIFYASGRSRT